MTDSGDAKRDLFPCSAIPDQPPDARLVGLYPQVQEGRWMQRLKIPGGRLTGEQWRTLAGIARRFTPTAPLHLTTRQDVEIHDLTAEQVPAVQEIVDRSGVSCLGACGDTLRNLTICPCSGVRPGSVDLGPLARQIRQRLEGLPGIYSLPRKFKIMLACGPDCGQPWINDLGLVAERRQGQWGFGVLVAGSLGARPGTGIVWKDWVPTADVLPLVLAALRVFEAHGDRENRRKARLRHVRQRVGDEAFLALLDEALAGVRGEGSYDPPDLPEAEGTFPASAMLTFANGDVSAAAAEALAELADREDLRVRIANHHRVIVFGADRAAVAAAVGAQAALGEAAKPQAAVVACPGKRWCSRALTHTNELADRIRAEAGDALAPGATVCISGCPNGCSHAGVADIGLTGGLAGGKEDRREVFHLLTGGGMGRTNVLAERVASGLSADEVIAAIKRGPAAGEAPADVGEED